MDTGPIWVAIGATIVSQLTAYGAWSWAKKNRATLSLAIVLGTILSFLLGFILGQVFVVLNTAYIVGLTMMSVAGGFIFLLSQVDLYKAVFTVMTLVSASLFFSGFLMIARGDQFGPTTLIGSMILGHFIGIVVSFITSWHIKGEEWKKVRLILFIGLMVMTMLLLVDLIMRRYFFSAAGLTVSAVGGFVYILLRSNRPRLARVGGILFLLGLVGYFMMIALLY